MPGGNGTGPAGMGPMTGRAAGTCAGYGMPGYVNPVGGRGYGRGFGMGFGRGGGWGGGGRGWRNRFYATGAPGWMWGGGWGGVAPLEAAPGQELAGLKQQAEYFSKTLDDIRSRIQELETKPAES